jgi:hypothetical protein
MCLKTLERNPYACSCFRQYTLYTQVLKYEEAILNNIKPIQALEVNKKSIQ